MDTLIDNRIFPQEMQEKPKEKKQQPKKQNGKANILVIVLLLIILALVYYVLVHNKKTTDTPLEEPVLTYEQEQSNVVDKLSEAIPEMTEEERIKRVNAFFAIE